MRIGRSAQRSVNVASRSNRIPFFSTLCLCSYVTSVGLFVKENSKGDLLVVLFKLLLVFSNAVVTQ